MNADNVILKGLDAELPLSASGCLFLHLSKPQGVFLKFRPLWTVAAQVASVATDPEPADPDVRSGLEEQIVTLPSRRAKILMGTLAQSAQSIIQVNYRGANGALTFRGELP